MATSAVPKSSAHPSSARVCAPRPHRKPRAHGRLHTSRNTAAITERSHATVSGANIAKSPTASPAPMYCTSPSSIKIAGAGTRGRFGFKLGF